MTFHTTPDINLITTFVKYLLQKPISCLRTFQHEDEHGHTPLYSAVEKGHLEVIEALLAHGANTEVSSS